MHLVERRDIGTSVILGGRRGRPAACHFATATTSCNMQGMQAAKQLQRNMAMEAELVGTVSHMYAAVISPHQAVCGDLAGWPQDVNMSRLVRYLGTAVTGLHPIGLTLY